jgi:hypothetical protein
VKSFSYLWGLTVVCVILVVVSLWKVVSLDRQLRNSDSSSLRESLKLLQVELASAKQLAPGLGEYMSTIQLHAAKLWFSAKASN